MTNKSEYRECLNKLGEALKKQGYVLCKDGAYRKMVSSSTGVMFTFSATTMCECSMREMVGAQFIGAKQIFDVEVLTTRRAGFTDDKYPEIIAYMVDTVRYILDKKLKKIKRYKAIALSNRKWIYGYLGEDGKYLYDINNCQEETPVDVNTLCVFTGLKDHKGNEIYTHDIVMNSMGGHYFALEAENAEEDYKVYDMDEKTYLEKLPDLFYLYVVGNTYNY